ncbi:protein split ends-like [Stegodyphus dumicola]|uniref:protein split ends-like n=1 Tax=Stegodyphus dumicola TaxID=202533 RepID=UPI0015AA54B4|nr:protein split ends-like [Stegodyphus dumicola]XP_035226585.1 protein split ends-like [Stegodyphus dumicola]XP_035226586.1 protein split ends-like [Stegodyphus dumicola]XP_035226587.1 protein split ends-like [Stegodyphus dumicola]XP_035226588.1 protein split ends-like [Stegodyphus dumicola]XP_035226589.1 protein split ends-like [Stegodyphus dumicola]
MPRKTSQAVKKDAVAADTKSEAGAPRRSGRAVTKQEPTSGRDATRSRRSSTAAQTAASVADSKTPKGRSSVSSRRESASPSDNRNRSGREGVESPATRVKSTRRSTGRVNYKESDGEEEAATPKYDENFESSEEFEESESDEKSKKKGKNKPVKAVTKGRGAKDKAKSARGRKIKPTKKKADEEEDEGFEASDDSQEPEIVVTGRRGKTTPVKEAPRSARSKKQKTEAAEVKKPAAEEKPKPSRRSARAASNKEETPKKRPSRRVQAKRYTEEEEDEEDIEETPVSKEEEDEGEVEEYVKSETEGSKKRKRASTSEASNKRVKETESVEDDKIQADDDKRVEDVDEKETEPETKVEVKEDKTDKDQSVEPMEVDESDSEEVKIEAPAKNETEVEEVKISEDKPEDRKDKDQAIFSLAKEKLSAANKQESIDSSENLDESMHSSDSEQESRAEHSLSSGLEDSQDSKDQKEEKVPDTKESIERNEKRDDIDLSSQSSESCQQIDDNSDEPKVVTISGIPSEPEKIVDKAESNVDIKNRVDAVKNDSSFLPESKPSEPDISPSAPPSAGSTIPSIISHSKESNCDVPVNGSEGVTVTNPPAHVIHSTSSVILEHKEDPSPKANGAHNDIHNNTTAPPDQYYLLPGRKYVANCKITETVRQAVKDQTFGFVSYNLGSPSYDPYLQKDKILNELNNLNAHVICLQQVAKPFFISVLQPSLDALGFKGDFCQPEDSLKGIVTFYKTSLFRITDRSEVSLKHLIEKELEVSSLDANDRSAVRAHVKRCGNVCFTQLTTVIGNHTITIANVQIPPTDTSVHALQVSCLAREIVRINGGTNKPLLLGGEFNMMESEAPYQLLRDGYLSNDMIEELQRRKDVVLPGKENASLLNLLWKSFQHPSSNLCSCYKSVLDHELSIPELKITSPDLLWYSSDSLYTVGVLDIISEKPGERHLSLKADVAFSV